MSEKILAVSAGHEITEKELNDLIANYPPEQQAYLSDPRAKDEVLEQLIGFYLFSEMAKEHKIKESREYKETLAKMENELASHMAATSVIDKVTVGEEETFEYYKEHPEQFEREAQGKEEKRLLSYDEIKDELHAKLLQWKKQSVYMETIKELEQKYGVERRR